MMTTIRLKEISTRAPEGWDKQVTKDKLEKVLTELDELQNLLFAESKHAVLVVIQGMDASGKDGTIRNLTDHNNTHILKFYLHISPKEQKDRLEERIHNPAKQWKYN